MLRVGTRPWSEVARLRLGLDALAAWEGAQAKEMPVRYEDLPLFGENR